MNRPMNTYQFSFMKYIRVMMLALLTLCGNRVVGQTFDYSEVQDIHIYPSSADEYNVNYTRLAAYSNNDIKSCLGDFSTFYIRWYAADDNLNVTSWTALGFDSQYNTWPFTKLTDNSYVFYYPGTDLYGDAANLGNGSSSDPFVKYLLNTHVTSSSGMLNTFSDVVVCEVSNEAYNSSSANKVKVRVIYHFQEGTVDSPFENVPDNLSSFTGTVSINEASSPANININLATYNTEQTAPSYIRWYFADASGNAVANPGFDLTNGTYSYTPQDNSIYYGGTTTDAIKALLNMTVTPQSGKSWSDLASYKLVALLSNEVGTTDEGGALTQEPLIATKYEISFEVLSFVGSTGNATSLSETVRLEDEAKSSVTLSLPLSKVEGSMDNEASSFYIRYYLTYKDNNRVALPTGVTITPLNNNITLTSNNYGQYWYSSTGIGSITDLGVTVADANSTVDLRNFNVVAVMSSNDPHEVSDGKVVYEPRQLEVVYTFNLEAPIGKDFDGNLASGGVTKTITKVIAEGQTSIELTDMVSDWNTTLKTMFPVGTDYAPAYRRVYVRDKKTKAILENQAGWITEDNTNVTFTTNELGSFWTKELCDKSGTGWQYENFTAWVYSNILSPTINVPDGASISLADCEVVIILSSGSETWTDGELTKGPEEHEVEYVFDFMTNVDLENRGFVHYKGYTNSDFTTVVGSLTTDNVAFNAQTGEYETVSKDIRQQTHEWTYEIYIEPGDSKDLILPIQNDNNLEPQAYFRWYDWNTDMGSPYLTEKSSTLLAPKYVTEETHRGLFALCLGGASKTATGTNPSYENVGVTFTAPEGDDWEEIVVACDISKYADGMDESMTYLLHEPTLSYRYKFVIRPARVIAEAIKQGVQDPNDGLLENHGDVTIGIKDEDSQASLRLNLSYVDNYYFYPYTLTHNEDGSRVETWSNELVEATDIFWRVYDASGEFYSDFSNKGKGSEVFFELSQSKLNGAYYRSRYASSDNNENKQLTFNVGEVFYVFAYASNADKSQSCPIARFNCRFSENYPIAADELENGAYRYRSVDYLEEQYTRVGLISFDIEEGSTLKQPTNQIDNANPMPFKWNRSHYGFCYPGLYSELCGNAISEWAGLGPLHGDYRLVKIANVTKTSLGIASDYIEKWHQDTKPLYDRTYTYSNQAQYGYFLYIDASDESRPIANVEFEGEMCVGSTLVLSAMVADMTTSYIHPQLIFKLYGIDTDVDGNETERKLIHSFATCDFSTVGASEPITWYQTFAKVILQKNTGVENYQHFLVSIDNYCDGTDGADYAIDDIRVYVQNAKAEVVQEKVACGEEKIETGIRMPHETLLAVLPTFSSGYMPIYYRICTKEGTPLTETDFYGTGQDNYGVAYIRHDFYDPSSSNTLESTLNAADTKLMTELGFTDDEKIAAWFAHHYQKGALGNHQVMLTDADQTFALDAGKEYYVSLTTPKVVDGNYVPDEDNWGNPSNVCSMYSKVFTPLKQSMKLLVGGEAINVINIDCGKSSTDNSFSITGQLQIPDASTGGFISIENTDLCQFDWFVEEKSADGTSALTTEIRAALKRFRTAHPDHIQTINTELSTDLVAENFTEEDRQLLNRYLKDIYTQSWWLSERQKLFLLNSATLAGPVFEVGKTYVITAIPLNESITYNGVDYDICPEPMEVTVEARLNGPELKLGFTGVTYPDDMLHGADVLRVGLGQLEEMQKGTPLHLPIHTFSLNGQNSSEGAMLLDEYGLFIVDTNDPTWNFTKTMYADDMYSTYSFRLASSTQDGQSMHEITADKPSVELYFHDKWHLVYYWYDALYSTTNINAGMWNMPSVEREVEFHEGYWYKVKFRYITKEEYEGNQNPWTRCYGETAFTIKVVPEYITWGDGLPNNSNWLNDDNWTRSTKNELYKEDYVDNGEGELEDLVENGKATDFAYVPMKFSKVTILGDRQTPYPYLSHLTPNVHSGIIDKQYMYNGDNSAPTTNIEYDMMVKVNPGQCPNDETKTNVYECERFYGNICKEIYFKPRAQLRYQHYLTYDKAWVEMELVPNRWNMLAAPLMKVHAGDFYVPKADGRQETEAFKAITFAEAEHSRNGYPFYQRSWDKAQSMVIVPDGDERGDYDAFIDYDWADKDMEVAYTQWSHAYNDVTEHYEPGKGFSLKAHHTEQKNNTLIRLPKADASYTYYNYEDGAGHKVDIDTTKQHRLAADGVATGMLKVTLAPNENETDNLYYLVGNPYMASLKMSSFFNTNSHLSKTYWVVVDNVPYSADETSGLGLVGPLQSFFVKNADGSPVESVTFSPAMTVSHLATATTSADTGSESLLAFTTRTTADIPAAQTRVILSTDADNGFVDEEDVETLLDSNLEDVPMVYTVAGTQAAMVNRLSDLTLLPLGIFGKEGITETVTVNGVDGFDQPLYLYDAVTRTQTPLEEGAELILTVGEHGRYFITTRAIGAPAEDEAEAWTVRAYSLQQGRLVVAAMPDDCLRRVQVYATNGTLVTDDVPADRAVTEYTLPAGTYVVKVETQHTSGSPHTLKVVVR